MKRRLAAVLASAGASLAFAVTGAMASPMHSRLAARLAGMGQHGTVNLQGSASSGKLCWTFALPSLKDATRATIHAGASGPALLELGMRYATTGCVKASAMTLEHLEAKPGAYSVWVDTKAHPGEVRGALFAGTAHR